MRTPPIPVLLAFVALATLAGCSSSPAPESTPAPPQSAQSGTPAQPPAPPDPVTALPNPETGFTRIVSGAGDSVGSIPGSDLAAYAYRFKQIEPGSERFTFQDRDLSFYFRPTPNALYFQVENRQNRPVWLEWDRSNWVGTNGTEKIAHASTRWTDRYGTQSATQIVGLQRYSDYTFPITLLVDPGSSGQQLHRVLFPEDATALQYIDRVFGVDLTFRIEDRYVPYSFRFKVASVVPR